MPYRYRFNEQAHEEFIETYYWYELKQAGLGERFAACVEKRLQQISEHPEYYSKKQRLNFREAKVEDFPYLIVYEFFPRKRLIHIAAIFHIRRNTKRKYRRMN